MQKVDVADSSLSLVFFEELLRFEVGNRSVVLVERTKHHPNRVGVYGIGDLVTKKFVGSIPNLAPIESDHCHGFSHTLEDEPVGEKRIDDFFRGCDTTSHARVPEWRRDFHNKCG
jgi:hypothetical protein